MADHEVPPQGTICIIVNDKTVSEVDEGFLIRYVVS